MNAVLNLKIFVDTLKDCDAFKKSFSQKKMEFKSIEFYFKNGDLKGIYERFQHFINKENLKQFENELNILLYICTSEYFNYKSRIKNKSITLSTGKMKNGVKIKSIKNDLEPFSNGVNISKIEGIKLRLSNGKTHNLLSEDVLFHVAMYLGPYLNNLIAEYNPYNYEAKTDLGLVQVFAVNFLFPMYKYFQYLNPEILQKTALIRTFELWKVIDVEIEKKYSTGYIYLENTFPL